MEVVRIFELSKEKLYSVEYDTDERHALQILQDQWEDQTYLYEFFKEWLKDYRKFYGTKKLTDIVEDAQNDADTLMNKLHDVVAERIKVKKLFKPLDDREDENESYELQKLKGKAYTLSFLRIYGLHYGNTIVITGGAIKLTKYMRDRDHTKLELEKLEVAKSYLADTENEAEIVYLDIS